MTSRKKKGFAEKSRDRIKAGKIETRLIDFVNGEINMTGAQVMAAKILMDRVLPSLKQIERLEQPDVEANKTPVLIIKTGSTEQISYSDGSKETIESLETDISAV